MNGKRINRGAGYSLEIPVEYVFNGNEIALQWAKKNLDNIDANVIKILEDVQNRNLNLLSQTCCSCFVFLACLLLGGNFYQECPIGTAYICLQWKVSAINIRNWEFFP